MKKTTKRKRGAQPGNTNAIKHGFYSSRIHPLAWDDPPTSQQSPDLENRAWQDIDHEISLIRTMLSRHLQLRQEHPAESPVESLQDMRVISFSISRLASLVRLRSHHPAGDLAALLRARQNKEWLTKYLSDPVSNENEVESK